jgi:SAM-dependent methyltransferase
MTEPDTQQRAEIQRIEAEYRLRDAGDVPHTLYSFADPAHVFYLQEIEWQVLRILRDLRADLAASRVLDVGCGFGYFTHRLAEYGARETTGVDLMQHRIDTARTRYPAVRFERSDGARLPFEGACFDLVTQFTCLSSVLDRDLRGRIAQEMWRVVTPRGLVLSYDIAPAGMALRALRAWRKISGSGRQRGSAAPTATRPVSVAELRHLFGQDPEITRRVILPPEVPHKLRASPVARQLLAPIPTLQSHALVAFRRGH